ncbi:D-alanyl-D-alanine carboxypeptidase family protein [Microbacterium sp.]|uniref:D-alanyl-D-alanine carboxypeptidase family protein n=1 Tax=Microbacterium sp. TaxID=51671 RepID=UPI003A8D909C
MTSEDQAPLTGGMTRRALRAHGGVTDSSPTPTLPFSDTADAAATGVLDRSEAPETDQDVDEITFDDDLEVNEPPKEWADEKRPATALAWLETADVKESTLPADLNAITMAEPGPDLFADAKLRPALLSGRWLTPLGTLAALAIAYSATMLLWPLHAVSPTVEAVEFTTAPAPAVEIVWPGAGSAGVSIAGVSASSSTADAASIASITKVVSTLMVLDRMPLQVGEPGPEFSFTYGDSVDYWDYRRADQSALDVPVDGVLTEYQLLQGTLLGSANNYIDRLARDLWGSDAQFADAAAVWLAERGLSDITIVTPSGFDEGNVATPAALLRLGERAMQNPVFAEIVGSPGAEIPGAGYVTNTNGMLADPGVVGIKTGTLVGWSLLTAKDVTIGDATVHLYTSVLNQASDDERLAVTRSLFAQIETALADIAPAVASGTVVGEVSTLWGEKIDVVTDEDAAVVLWNGATADAAVVLDLGDERAEGDTVGVLTVDGPINTVTGSVSLAEDIADPSPWWRLTHPMELLGIDEK